MPRKIIALLAAALLAACQSDETKFQKIAEDAVRSVLTDPQSAQFSDLYVVQQKQKTIKAVCGYVNAKNVYGGYAGRKRFVVLLSVSGENIIPAAKTIERSEDSVPSGDLDSAGKPITLWDKVYWNDSCVDEKHPA